MKGGMFRSAARFRFLPAFFLGGAAWFAPLPDGTAFWATMRALKRDAISIPLLRAPGISWL